MAKKIEEKYTSMSEREHILHRSGMYIGSIKEEDDICFIYDNYTEKMRQEDVTYSPGMLKLFDEILSNSCDEYRRKDNMGLTGIDVTINKETNEITIKDNGGIPIVMHKDAGVYVPEFIFGQLRTSSNYDDTEDRNVIGTNGLGSVLSNIFSKEFRVESCDKKNKIVSIWTNNMETHPKPTIEKCKDHYTSTTFLIDFDRFDQKKDKGITKDFINILHKRCIDAAAANLGLKVTFNIVGDISYTWCFKKFEEYMELYRDYIDMTSIIKYGDDLKQVWVCPNSPIDIAFVNGAECSKGTHIKAVRQPVDHSISEVLKKKYKIEITNKAIDNRYGIFGLFNISNPTYSSQTKNELTVSIDNFYKDGSKFNIPDDFLKKVQKSEIVNLVIDWYKQKMQVEDAAKLRKLNREAKNELKRPDKYITCTSKKKSEKQLWIFEGDSAKAGFRVGRNPQTQAGYTMRGVPLNCLGMTPIQIMKNEVFNDLISIIGLSWGKQFSIDQLNFGKIVISSDADVDGDKIACLLCLFFNNWPELFKHNIVCRSISPIIIATKGKDERKYYKMEDYKAEEKKLKGYQIKYTKGLAGLNPTQSKAMYQEPIFQYFKKDDITDDMFNKWFDKDSSDIRKDMLSAV